jgi:hypothetical protein
MNLAYEIHTLQIALLYSRWPSLVIRLLFIQIQFSGNALDLILETGENYISDMFIGIIYMCVCMYVCVYIYIYIYIRLSLLNVVCCTSRGLCIRPITGRGESYRVSVCPCMWSDEAVTVHIYSEWIELVELRRKHWCNGRRLFIAFMWWLCMSGCMFPRRLCGSSFKVCSRYSDSLRAGRSVNRFPMGERFSAPVQTGLGAHPASYRMGTGSLSAVKRPWRGIKHPPHPAPRLKKG